MEGARDAIVNSRELMLSADFDPWNELAYSDGGSGFDPKGDVFAERLSKKIEYDEQRLHDADRRGRQVRFCS